MSKFYNLKRYFETVTYYIVTTYNARSCWAKGVEQYAQMLAFNCGEFLPVLPEYSDKAILEHNLDFTRLSYATLSKMALNGATSWLEFSFGGCALISDYEICRQLCTPSEKVRFKDGALPLRPDYWLKVQARALAQAFRILHFACEHINLEDFAYEC